MTKAPTISILTVGDELLIGQVVDTNSAFMARLLNSHGMEVFRKYTIADTLTAITSALEELSKHSDVILMTGGLGPTKDDVTKKALAQYFGVDMVFSDFTWDRIERFFARLGRSTTPAHREQCYMPANATLLTNRMGTAPGMWMQEDQTVVVSMPGVPYEMQYLMENEVVPKLLEQFTVRPIAHRTLLTIGEGESRLAAQIEDIEDALPEHLSLAYLPNLGQVRIRLTGRADELPPLQADLKQYGDQIKGRLQAYVFGEGESKVEEVVGQLLQQQNLTLATAESCTGGYVAHRITSIPGSSTYFQGSVVAYDNRIKEHFLQVPNSTLIEHGAVSKATVEAMVAGACQQLGVDIAIATSGIAGPGGGTEEKPVGTIWIAVGNAERVETVLIHGSKDRSKNIQYTASRALGLLWHYLRD